MKYAILKTCPTCKHCRAFTGTDFSNKENGHRRVALECAKGHHPFECENDDWDLEYSILRAMLITGNWLDRFHIVDLPETEATK